MNTVPFPAATLARPRRQVHLDFHNSPLIPDVGAAFDAGEFARTMAAARVESVTLCAKCHHGMNYFPAKAGTPHPALAGRDLLGEQIAALHQHGIRATLYTTIAWEEQVAATHPEWRQLLRDGSCAQTTDAGPWKFLNFLHPDYQEYIEAHLREICARYGAEVDGLFLDILTFHPGACWSDVSRRFRERAGLAANTPGMQERFQTAAQAAFADRFTPLLQGLLPAEATLFYNAPTEPYVDSTVGPRVRYARMSHAEIESLPGGRWGYQHFPRVARALSHWGKPWLGMTARFFKSWGDFGGLRPPAALEFECFRAQALGGGNSVGDQMHPRGTLDLDAYRIIGDVYRQCEEAEPFYAGSHALPNFGNLCAGYPGLDPEASAKSDEGAMLMAQEMHRDVAMLDESDDLSRFPLVQLPDSVVITPTLATKLRAYYEDGGTLLISCRSGFAPDGRWALDFLPFKVDKDGRYVETYPTYWRSGPEMLDAVGRGDRVCYLPGVEVLAGSGSRVLVERVSPYFRRTNETFSSHQQVPPAPEPAPCPAVIAGERFIYFADPIFREFRQAGNPMMRDSWHVAMNALIGNPPFGDGLPHTIQVIPRRRGSDLLLTLLHYIPVSKASDLDIIEERSSLAGERLRLPAQAREVRQFGGTPLVRAEEGTFVLPAVKGRLLLEVPGYFAAPVAAGGR